MNNFSHAELIALQEGTFKSYFGTKDEIIRKLCEDLMDALAIVEEIEDDEILDEVSQSIDEATEKLQELRDKLNKLEDKG